MINSSLFRLEFVGKLVSFHVSWFKDFFFKMWPKKNNLDALMREVKLRKIT